MSFTLLRPPVGREMSIICTYICILLEFCNFLKSQNSRSREMKIKKTDVSGSRNSIAGRDERHIILGEIMCLFYIFAPPRAERNSNNMYAYAYYWNPAIPRKRKTRARVKWKTRYRHVVHRVLFDVHRVFVTLSEV